MAEEKLHKRMHIQEALNTAIKMEISSRDFFLKAMKEVEDPAVRVLFEELAEEEKVHQQKLEAEMERGVLQEM